MHPILCEIPLPFGGALPLHAYGLMMMLAFVAGTALTLRRAPAAGLSPEVVLDLALYALVAGIVGARLAWLCFYYRADPASEHPLLDLVSIWRGGLVFQGGLALALVVCIGYVLHRRVPAGAAADLFAPGLALGLAFGRTGCFLNGCCFGKIAGPDWPLGVTFPARGAGESWSGVFMHHYGLWRDGALGPLLDRAGQGGMAEAFAKAAGDPPAGLERIPVHPTQLYELAGALLIALFLLWLERRPARVRGGRMLLFLALYSVLRFGVEMFRDDTPLVGAWGAFPGLRTGQVLALGTLLVAGAIYLRLRRASAAGDPPP